MKRIIKLAAQIPPAPSDMVYSVFKNVPLGFKY